MSSKVRKVCVDCAMLAGKTEGQFSPKGTLHKGKCDICKQNKQVSEVHFWGMLTHAQIAQAKHNARKLGMLKSQVANPEDVEKLIGVVEKVLGDKHMSQPTGELVQGLKVKLSLGQPIQLFDTKRLTASYVNDVELWETQKAMRKARREQLHPSPKLHIIEGGRESVRTVRSDAEDDEQSQGHSLLLR